MVEHSPKVLTREEKTVIIIIPVLYTLLQVTLSQSAMRTDNRANCGKMESDDSWEKFVVKIEIDTAEEPLVSWRTEKEQG